MASTASSASRSATRSHATDAADAAVDRSPVEATAAMCYYCWDVLGQELCRQSQNQEEVDRLCSGSYESLLTSLLPIVACPLFVTWEKQSPLLASNQKRLNKHNQNTSSTIYTLRGCIGTLTPKALTLETMREYALWSARRDQRFDPVTTLSEYHRLRVSVSILVHYESCRHCTDWTVGLHGIVIRFSSAAATVTATTISSKCKDSSSSQNSNVYSATFLPEVAAQQGWDTGETIRQLIRKSGYLGDVDDSLLQSIECTRYQSSKATVTFEEYEQYCKHRTRHKNANNNSSNAATTAATMDGISDDIVETTVGNKCNQEDSRIHANNSSCDIM